jgi:glycosyltransferase involved in cell wall biosynthesis
MRIMLVCEAYLSIGGVAEIVDNLAVEFGGMNHDISVVSNPVQGATIRVPCARAEYFAVRIPRHQPVTWRHPERILHRRSPREFLELIHRWRPEVVNLQGPLWARLPAALDACLQAKVPTVLSLHDLASNSTPEKTAVRSIERARSVTFLSHATRASFASLMVGKTRSRIITGGVDCSAAKQASAMPVTRPYVFCAARINLEHKAIDSLVGAFKLVADAHPELDLLISGDGPDRVRLEQIVERSELAQRVQLLGPRTRSELWSLYKGATLFAMPSRKPEGLGLAFLESMACGRPVIGSNSGGTPEIVRNGETGLLVQRNESDEIAHALRQLLDNPEERERMARNGRELVTRCYDWPTVAQQYLEVYTETLGSYRQ